MSLASSRKQFDKTEYKKNDGPGKSATIIFFESIGWKAVDIHEEHYAEYDIKFETPDGYVFVEVERRTDHFEPIKNGLFRFQKSDKYNWKLNEYPDISIPAKKITEASKSDFYAAVSADGSELIFFSIEDARQNHTIEWRNVRNNLNTEPFAHINFSICQYFSVK